MADLPTALHFSFAVEWSSEDDRECRRAVSAVHDAMREAYKGINVGPLRLTELTGVLADFSGDRNRPILAVIMEALIDRGWRIDGNNQTMISPFDGLGYQLQDAIGVQTMREIARAGGVGEG